MIWLSWRFAGSGFVNLFVKRIKITGIIKSTNTANVFNRVICGF